MCAYVYYDVCARKRPVTGNFSKNLRKTRYCNDIIMLYDFIAFTVSFGLYVYVFKINK